MNHEDETKNNANIVTPTPPYLEVTPEEIVNDLLNHHSWRDPFANIDVSDKEAIRNNIVEMYLEKKVEGRKGRLVIRIQIHVKEKDC